MTRTDVDAKSMTIRPSRRRGSLRRLLVAPVALLLVAALAAPAMAAEPTSGYTHPTTGKQETLPSKSKTAPQSESKPTTTTPATTTAPATSAPAKGSTLPFTGFDLRWTVSFGLLLMGAGTAIVMVQRRQRRDGGR